MEEKPLETGQGWENGRREPRWRRLWLLFSGMFYISAFTFGGGFVIVTFMKRKFVDTLHWLDEQEMLDFTALAQSSPGAIAVNAAILVGLKICGAAGMAAAVLGTILPPMIILSVVSFFYSAFSSNLFVALALKGMQAGVAAVILDVAWDLGEGMVKKKSLYLNLILAGAFAADLFLGVNVVYIILAGFCELCFRRKIRKEGRAPCDLFTAFFQLFKGGNVQCRRRLCGHSADPEPGSRSLRVADDG